MKRILAGGSVSRLCATGIVLLVLVLASLLHAQLVGPWKTHTVDHEQHGTQFHIRVAEDDNPQLNILVSNGMNVVMTGASNWVWYLGYARSRDEPSSNYIWLANVGVGQTNNVVFTTVTADFPNPVERWYCVLMATNSNGRYTWGHGLITIEKSPSLP